MPAEASRQKQLTVRGEEWILHEGIHRFDPYWALYTNGAKAIQTYTDVTGA